MSIHQNQLLKFLKESGLDLDKLYQQPHTCPIIMRELPIMAQHMINRVLFVNTITRTSLIYSWVQAHQVDFMNELLRELVALNIFIVIRDAEIAYRMNRYFQESLKFNLFGGKICDAILEYPASIKPLSKEVLLSKADYKWDAILSTIAGSVDNEVSNPIVSSIINDAAFVNSGGMTKEGFDFILLPRSKQIWQFIVSYLRCKINCAVDILEIICQLGSGDVYKYYTLNPMTDSKLSVLRDMDDFGLVHLTQAPEDQLFIVQPGILLSDLINGVERLEQSQANIFTLSNEKIYSRTTSKLHLGILSIFCDISECLSYVVYGAITDASIKRANDRGLTADQIIQYLKMNVSQESIQEKTIIPRTIIDKIKMVDALNSRVKIQSGCLYREFSDYRQFELLLDYAQKKGVLLWSKHGDRAAMIVSEESHNDIRKYYKKIKNGAI